MNKNQLEGTTLHSPTQLLTAFINISSEATPVMLVILQAKQTKMDYKYVCTM